MVRQARSDEQAALRAASIQSSPHTNRFIPMESQANGMLMPAPPHAQAMPSPFQLNDLSFGLPGGDPTVTLPEGQPRNFQANGGEMTNPVLNGDHAPAVSGVSHNSTALTTLSPAWNRPLPPFIPPSQSEFAPALLEKYGLDHAPSVSQLPHRGHQGHLGLGLHTDNALPQVSDGCCFSEPPTQPLLGEPSPLAADVPMLSSPATGVSSTVSLNQSPESKGKEVASRGKDLEGSATEYDSMVTMAPQTTLYSIPPTYATAENPMTEAQHAQLQQDAHFNSQTVPQYAPYGITGSAAPSAEQFVASDFLHLCDCGPNCQCEMCAVHPYNPTAQSHMEDMANFIASDIGSSAAHSRRQSNYGEAYPGTAYSSGADAGLLGTLGGMTEGADFGQLMLNEYQADGNSASNPDGTLSTFDEATQRFAQSHDYLTFQYSFPGSDI
ncbi:MAG: hypothetical protein Q9211_005057 [Gyalolechia sp. 1 TL-2023]